MSKTIFTWNINCATNRSILIPDFVGKEISQQNCDFFVLTEFCKTKNHKSFIDSYITKNNYDCVLTNNPEGHNDILIAWKKRDYQKISEEKDVKTTGEHPNFAYVELLDKNSEQKIVIAGIRITIESYINRQKQLRYVLNCLKKFESNRVIIAGDFNCLRRGTSVKEWNLNVLSDMSKNEMYNITTPEGQSIYAEKALRTEYEFAEDHFLSKGIDISNAIYDRSFTDRNTDVYLHGKNFSVYNPTLRRNIWSINVGSGIPDHAILRADINTN